MKNHLVRVYPSKEKLPRENQLAWKMAEIAADNVAIKNDVTEMVINRMIDNASVAIAAANRRPVATARSQALAHPRDGGATVFGLPNTQKFSPEWAAWANGTAVRELDFHDTFLAACIKSASKRIASSRISCSFCLRVEISVIRIK